MGLLITTNDFIGVHKVAQTSTTELDAYINQYEEKYLIDLLGLTLYNLFKADIVNHVPVTTIYLDIFNKIQIENNGLVAQNHGMKSMILGFVFGEYMAKQPIKRTAIGSGKNTNDNFTQVGFYESGASNIYNEAVKDAEIIQYYIKENKTDYPDYAGTKLRMWHWSL